MILDLVIATLACMPCSPGPPTVSLIRGLAVATVAPGRSNIAHAFFAHAGVLCVTVAKNEFAHANLETHTQRTCNARVVLTSVCFDPCVGQDLPEFRVDDLDCEEPASDEFREQWLVDAEEFLRHHLESQQKGRKRPGGKVSKLGRVAGFHWMVTIEHQLRFFSNAGLGQYLLSDDDPCRTLSIAELAKRPDR